jgi:uncharacterized RDD family membrane protein YckC
MDIWIIRDGEKVGPLHDYEIRRKIEDGELPATTPAWHEGLGEWRPLDKIEIFSREFELVAEKPSPYAPPSTESATPPPLPVKTYYIRRFWARWFDLTLYAGLWWLGMWFARQDIAAALTNGWIIFLHFVPWFAIETLLLHYTGTTPGKWLLGLKVANLDGTRLNLSAATRRSLQVLCIGIGFGYNVLAVFCQMLSLVTAKRLGTPLWDYLGGHQVTAGPLRPLRIVTLVVLFYCALQLQAVVVSPYMFDMAGESMPEWMKKELEKNPPWHLPKRS